METRSTPPHCYSALWGGHRHSFSSNICFVASPPTHGFSHLGFPPLFTLATRRETQHDTLQMKVPRATWSFFWHVSRHLMIWVGDKDLRTNTCTWSRLALPQGENNRWGRNYVSWRGGSPATVRRSSRLLCDLSVHHGLLPGMFFVVVTAGLTQELLALLPQFGDIW
jgi:hypothetical protein